MSPSRFALLLLFCVPAAFAVQDCELNGEHVNPANGYTTEGKTGMMKLPERDSGQAGARAGAARRQVRRPGALLQRTASSSASTA